MVRLSSLRIRTINRRPCLTVPMFKMSTCNVKEPTHNSKRVGHEVPGIVLWLSFSLVNVTGCSEKACGVWGHVRKNSHKSKRNFAEC